MSVWELSGKEQQQDSNLLRARWKPELFPARDAPFPHHARYYPNNKSLNPTAGLLVTGRSHLPGPAPVPQTALTGWGGWGGWGVSQLFPSV